MKKRLVVAALVALALAAVSALPALAAKPSTANQLRTTRILSFSGATPIFTINTDSLAGPSAQGVKYEGTAKKLMVIDWISFTATAGAVAEDFEVAILDDNSNILFDAKQTVLANTTETLFFQFPTGFPMFNARVGGQASITRSREDPCAIGAVIQCVASSGGRITMGHHMEATDDRTP